MFTRVWREWDANCVMWYRCVACIHHLRSFTSCAPRTQYGKCRLSSTNIESRKHHCHSLLISFFFFVVVVRFEMIRRIFCPLRSFSSCRRRHRHLGFCVCLLFCRQRREVLSTYLVRYWFLCSTSDDSRLVLLEAYTSATWHSNTERISPTWYQTGNWLAHVDRAFPFEYLRTTLERIHAILKNANFVFLISWNQRSHYFILTSTLLLT